MFEERQGVKFEALPHTCTVGLFCGEGVGEELSLDIGCAVFRISDQKEGSSDIRASSTYNEGKEYKKLNGNLT